METTILFWLVFLLICNHLFIGIFYLWVRLAPQFFKKIYALETSPEQVKMELKSSIFTTPVHVLIIALVLYLELFSKVEETFLTGLITFVLTFVWTEIWHYASHRAMHWRPLLFIHRHHHKSMLTNPFTAVSFSMLEKSIFSLGIVFFVVGTSYIFPISINGMCLYYAYYFFTNVLGHSNLEFRRPGYLSTAMGKVFNSPTFHSLHHSRYINHYGLMTPLLDKAFGTMWEDHHLVFDRAANGLPLSKLNERVSGATRVTESTNVLESLVD